MIRIYRNNVLLYSGAGINTTLTIDVLRNPQTAGQFLAYELLEIDAISGEIFADVTVDSADGVLALYGQTEDLRLVPEEKAPLGLRCLLAAGRDWPATLPRYITFAFKDAAGASLGTLRFNFICRRTGKEALCRVRAGSLERLPDFQCEPGRPRGDSFGLETLQPTLVSYSIVPLTPPGQPFLAKLPQPPATNSANSYSAPDGPPLDVQYFGRPGTIGKTNVFFVEADDGTNAPQRIPFICWIVDTPGRGELVIDAIDPDPVGPDRFAESLTLRNTGARTLNLTGCYIEDEQPMSLFGIPLNLPRLNPGRHVLPRTRLQPGATLQVRPFPDFRMNNDYDAFQLRNRLGRRLDFRGYLRRLPGTNPPPAPAQRVIERQTVILDRTDRQAIMRFANRLEDGDFVTIRARGTFFSNDFSLLWFPITPAGLADRPAPEDAPLPGAPSYALLMGQIPSLRLIGSTPQFIVIDRQSGANFGLSEDRLRIDFWRNDTEESRPWPADGAFVIDVTLARH